VFHVKHEGWTEAAAGLNVVIDPQQASRLDAYEELLRTRAAPLGMISEADVPRIRERHVLDGLRAAAFVDSARSAYDVGSGAGLPGIPLAIASPELLVTLVESRRNRAAFLELAVEILALPNVSVLPGRVEDLSERVDLVTARAFTDAAGSWRVAEPLLLPGGRLIYFAGTGFEPESEAPEGADLAVFTSPGLARSGPLAIMSRQ
jgi:16S rRNA (guanine527-N7)-methyltransferase